MGLNSLCKEVVRN